ncbi:MAG: hypothetical protein M3Z56_07540 [Bacteroidota bacterium]|nr:hypothetical protein [Bacteroidota bacterium]
MPFDAKIFQVLIASPGDVGEERNIIPELINEWNAMHSAITKILLMPVKWETHSAPLLGDRPQAIINQQLGDCDLLVGVFWTRIGTDTGVSVSGTAEEIERFVAADKPAMLYFSESPVEPHKIELDQLATLRTFREKMRLKGLTETYFNISNFREKFSRQLHINVVKIIRDIPSDKKENTAGAKKQTTTKKEIKTDLTLINNVKEQLTPQKIDEYLIKAAQSVSDESGWANVAAVGRYLYTYTPVNYKEFGFQKLFEFLKSRNLFQTKIEKKSTTSTQNRYDTAFIKIK